VDDCQCLACPAEPSNKAADPNLSFDHPLWCASISLLARADTALQYWSAPFSAKP
jgi:hypothetical protein